jgi:putative toxin-antitoxin system antitoxin component (TIGR02293 family)
MTVEMHKDAEPVISKALELFGGDRAIVDDWMTRRIPALGDQRPIDLMTKATGRKLVLDTLGRIEHGVYA